MRPVSIALSALVLGAAALAQQAPLLPVTLTDGDLKATIKELAIVPPLGERDADDPHDSIWTRVSLKLDWGGPPPRDWAISRITVFDAQGRKYSPMRHSGSNYRTGDGYVFFSGPMWDMTQPWRVRLEFARHFPNTGDFRKVYEPHELLVVERVPVPKVGEVLKDGRSAEQDGAKLQLIGVAGANAEMPDGLPVKRVSRPCTTGPSARTATTSRSSAPPIPPER